MIKTYHFSAPGRTELGGNHTDHQNGCILAASVNLEVTAEVTLNHSNTVRIFSDNYDPFDLELDDLSCREEEKGTSISLVRGVLQAFQALGVPLQGFDANIRSNVPVGSGLSSSAAFEVLLGTICNTLFGENRLSPTQIAQIGQQVENTYFGKPCGLMDQLTCATGGIVFIDFQDPAVPQVKQVAFDLAASGYALCILDTGSDHADLTEEYAAITRELRTLCAYFGAETLRQVPQAQFLAALPDLKNKLPHRAILRAMHIYDENTRVKQQVAALSSGDLPEFFRLVQASGDSSWMYLQNIYPAGAIQRQPMALALALCKSLLAGQGACRVHGGGFAGTIQAYVPRKQLDAFRRGFEAVFGENSCRVLTIHDRNII